MYLRILAVTAFAAGMAAPAFAADLPKTVTLTAYRHHVVRLRPVHCHRRHAQADA